MRAFRPSQFAHLEEGLPEDPIVSEIRQQNVQTYAKRAEAKTPLFVEGAPAPEAKIEE